MNEWGTDTADVQLWLETLGYFTRFAATGDPNGDGAPQWPLYDADSDPHMVLDDPIHADSNAADKCSFWADKDYLVPEIGND